MTAPPRLHRLDVLLLALGAVGLVLAAVLLPRYHPDAAASYGIGRQGAIEAAQAFMQASGYTTDDLRARAHLVRDGRLLDTMQVRLGRRATIVALAAGGRERVPAYHWRVTLRAPGAEGERASDVFVRLTSAGRVWGLSGATGLEADRATNAAVLREALGPAAADTAGSALLTFDLREAVDADTSSPESSWQPGGAEASAVLNARHAVRIAEVHLRRTALTALPLEVRAVEPLAGRGSDAARVRFVTSEPALAQTAEVDVDITAAGRLLDLRTQFNGVGTQLVHGVSIGPGGDGRLVTAMRWGGYAILLLVLLGVVLRRIAARALDVRAALRDASVAALAASLSIVLVIPAFAIEGDMPWWGAVLLALLIAAFTAIGVSFIVFIASAGGDALARMRWPSAVPTLSLARQGAWVNVPVGRALLRGVGLGLALVGLAALALASFPDGPLRLSGQNSLLGAERTLSLFAVSFVSALWYAQLAALGVGQGLGALLHGWRPAAVVPGLALAFTVLSVAPIQLPSGSPDVTWGILLAVGIVLALAFYHVGVVAFIVGLVVAGTVWGVAEGWVVPGSPAWVDVGLASTLVVGLLAVGWAGVRSGRTGDALPVYEPDFVREQRERARLQQELEIAREVQRSFLPERVPAVEGVELAARCVPAEEVGGDYYDLIRLGPDRLGVVIGDVSGKGIQAAFFMTLVKGFLLALASEVARPADVLCRLNRLFAANAPRGIFISMLYGVMDLKACTFTFARAGHTPLLVRRAGGGVEVLRPPGLAIGMTAGAAFDETLGEVAVQLCPGDTLVLYTDGLSEAMDPQRRLYTDERVAKAVGAAPAVAAQLLDLVVADARGYAGASGLHDDLTMVVLQVASPLSPLTPPPQAYAADVA